MVEIGIVMVKINHADLKRVVFSVYFPCNDLTSVHVNSVILLISSSKCRMNYRSVLLTGGLLKDLHAGRGRM